MTVAVNDERRRGRRPAASRSILEEAAGELFLEQGYASTTIEQITQRAGVSRATFFNYFTAKSDLLWSEVDASVEWLREEIACRATAESPMEGLRAAVEQTAARFSPTQLPLAATQFEVMGVGGELQASGVPRFVSLAGVVEEHLAPRIGEALGRVVAFAVIGAAVAAAIEWAGAGVARGSLDGYVREAVRPVCDGFARSAG